jgi:hypothetical protein
VADDFAALIAQRRAQKLGTGSPEDFRTIIEKRRQEKRLRAQYEPSLEKQAEKMEPEATLPLAAKLAATTTPAVREAAMVGGEALSQLGVPGVGVTEQGEFLEEHADSSPQAAVEAAQRRTMARKGGAGYKTGLARGVEAGGEAAFTLLPGGAGVKALAKGGAAALPAMLGPTAAMSAAGLLPGAEHVMALPGEAGAAVARTVGAEEGGAGEAVGRALGAMAPTALLLALSRRVGASAARGGLEPAARVGRAPVSGVPAAVAAEGGIWEALKGSPSLLHEAATVGAMLPQGQVAPAVSQAATALGASPEAAQLAGATGGLVIPLAASIPEARLAEAGARGVRKEQVEALRTEKQAERTGRLANAEEQAAEIKKQAESDLETRALHGMEVDRLAEEAAKKGFAGEVATLLSRTPSLQDRATQERVARPLAEMWAPHFEEGAPAPVPPEVVGPARAAVGRGEAPAGGEALSAAAAEARAADAAARGRADEAQGMAEHRDWLRQQVAGQLAGERQARAEKEQAAAQAPDVFEAMQRGPVEPDVTSAAGDVIEAPAGSLLRVGTGFVKVVEPSKDGRTVLVQAPGEAPRPMLATEADEVVWRPGETPGTAPASASERQRAPVSVGEHGPEPAIGPREKALPPQVLRQQGIAPEVPVLETETAKRAKYGLPPNGNITLYRAMTPEEHAEWQSTGIIKKGLAGRATTDPKVAEFYASKRGPGAQVIKFEADVDSGIVEGGNEPGTYRLLRDIKTHEPQQPTSVAIPPAEAQRAATPRSPSSPAAPPRPVAPPQVPAAPAESPRAAAVPTPPPAKTAPAARPSPPVGERAPSVTPGGAPKPKEVTNVPVRPAARTPSQPGAPAGGEPRAAGRAPEVRPEVGAAGEPRTEVAPEAGVPGGGAEHGGPRGAGGAPGKRPEHEGFTKLVTASEEHDQPVDDSNVPENLKAKMYPHQIQGTAKALAALEEQGGFILADGTGAGKTRQILSVAKVHNDQGRTVLIVGPKNIVTDDWKTVKGSYKDDAKDLGVEVGLYKGPSTTIQKGKTYLTTYQQFQTFPVDENVVLVFDEAQALKNAMDPSKPSSRGLKGLELADKAHGVIFASATPGDKPHHIAYMGRAGIMEGKPFRKFIEDMGFQIREQNIKGRIIEVIAPVKPIAEIRKRLADLFNRQTGRSLMVKREISLETTDGQRVPVDVQWVDLPPEAHETLRRLEEAFGDKPQVLTTHHRLQQEPYKVEITADMAKEEIGQGRKVIVYAARVNKADAVLRVKDSEGNIISEDVIASSEGTIKSLREALAKRGLTKVVEYHGGVDGETKAENVKAFMEGDANVLIATVESGGAGLNFDDRMGNSPRTMLFMTPPWDGINNVQAIGRIHRLTTKSLSKVRYILGKTDIDRHNIAVVMQKLRTLGAIVKGEIGQLREGMSENLSVAEGGVMPGEEAAPRSSGAKPKGSEAIPTAKPVEEEIPEAPPLEYESQERKAARESQVDREIRELRESIAADEAKGYNPKKRKAKLERLLARQEEPGTEPGPTREPGTKKEIADLYERYDTGDEKLVTPDDLVDAVEEVADRGGHSDLLAAVEDYREAASEDMKDWGGRGDMDAEEAKFLKAVKKFIKEPPVKPGGPTGLAPKETSVGQRGSPSPEEAVRGHSVKWLEEMAYESPYPDADTFPMVQAAKAELARRGVKPPIDIKAESSKPVPPEPPKIEPPKPRTPKPSVPGSETVIQYGKETAPARWAAMEASDLEASHEVYKEGGVVPLARARKGYPEGIQEREYDPRQESGRLNWAKVEGIAKNLEPSRLVSDIPIATEGTPIVTPDGTVLGGNGRTLGMQLRLSQEGNLATVKARLLEKAADYGLDPAAIEKMENPVLVRVVEKDLAAPETKEFARRINIPETHEESPVRVAASMNHLIDPDLFKALGGDFDAAFSEAVSGPKGLKFRKALMDAIDERQRERYFEPDAKLTKAGQDLVEKMLVTKVLDPRLVEQMPDQMAHAFAKSAVQLGRVAEEFSGLNPTAQINEAVRYYNDHIKPSGLSVDDYFQPTLGIAGDHPPISPAAKMVLRFLDRNMRTPNKFKERWSALLETLRQEHKSLLATTDPAELFASALDVPMERGAEFGPHGQILGIGLGAIQGMPKAAVMRVLRGVLGGAAGFAYADLSDTSDDPEKIARRRLWYAILGAALGAGTPGWRQAMQAGRWAMERTPEKVRRLFRGGIQSTELWRSMETAEEKAKWLAHDVALALPEWEGNRAYERAVVSHMAGEHGYEIGSKKFYADLEKAEGRKKADEVRRAVDRYRTENDRLADAMVFYKLTSPETAEQYRNGWAKRLMLNVIETKGKPPTYTGHTPRPKIGGHEVKQDGHNLLLDGVSERQVQEALNLSGAQDPWMTEYGTRLRHGTTELLKWEPTQTGKDQKDLFLEGLKEVLREDGKAPRGGLDRFILLDEGPMGEAEREAHGEIVNPKAVAYLSLEGRAREVAHGKFYYDVSKASDSKGVLSVAVPKDPKTRRALYSDGEFWTDKNGQQYAAVPNDYSWGHLAGKGLRREWYDALTDYKKGQDATDALMSAIKAAFKGTKIATPGGFARNFLGNPIMAFWAKGLPRTPKELMAFSRVMRDFARAAATGDRRIIRHYLDDVQIQLHDREFQTGSKGADALLDRYAAAGRDAAIYTARKKGETVGDLLSLGQLSGGYGKIPGYAVAGAGGAVAGALVGAAGGDDWKDVLKKAAYGGLAGAALNKPLRSILRNYSLVDAAWKAAVANVHKVRGVDRAESHRLIQDRMQDFEHPSKIEKMLSGSQGGAGGAIVTMTVNPFIKWYTQLLRTFKNTAAEDPGRAALGFMAVPILEALGVGGAALAGYNVFGSKEERRAAEEKTPGAVHVRIPGLGKPQAVDLSNIAIMEGIRGDIGGLFGSYPQDAGREILGDVLGSPLQMPYDVGTILNNPNPRDLRGFSMVEPGKTKGGAIMKRGLAAGASPLAPNVGGSVKALENAVTDQFQAGRVKRPSEPLRAAARIATGIPVRPVDPDKDLQSLISRYFVEKKEAEEAYRRAKGQAEIRSNPEKMREQATRMKEAIREARERFKSERARIIPRQAGDLVPGGAR